MKKLLALTLALMMALSLATVAMAADGGWVEDTEFDGWINITFADDLIEADLGFGGDGDAIYVAPGSTLTADVAGLIAEYADMGMTEEEISKALKSIKAGVKITRGNALIDTLKLSGDKLKIVLNENYTITDPKLFACTIDIVAKSDIGDPDNLDFKKGETIITLVFSSKGIATIENGDENFLQGVSGVYVTNATVMVEGTKKADDADEIPITGVARNNIVYICDEDEPGYVKFNGSGDLFRITAKMNKEEKVYLHMIENDKDILDELEEANPDAEIETYTLEGRVPFKNAASYTLQGDYSDQYKIYSFKGKKLTAVKSTWNNEDGVYEWSGTEMTTYVISDTELEDVAGAEEEATDPTDKNPNTGL